MPGSISRRTARCRHAGARHHTRRAEDVVDPGHTSRPGAIGQPTHGGRCTWAGRR